MTAKLFTNRLDAAERLIPILREFIDDATILLAIPRGAVPMGFHIAKALHVPFDILLVKKIGYPGNPELAVGSVSVNGVIIDPEFALRKDYINLERKRLLKILQEREVMWRGESPPLPLREKTVIIIDDGMATGNTMLAALDAVKQQLPRKIIVALPVAPESALSKIKTKADEVLCLHTPRDFIAVAEFYENFEQVNDADVKVFMSQSKDLNQQ